MADDQDLYKKISSLRSLKDAIKVVKSNMKPNAEPELKKEESKAEQAPEMPLKYLGRKKMIAGVLSHIIGTGNENDGHYELACHLEKHAKGIPSIIVTSISPKGEVLDHSDEYFKDMKSAIKAIVNHKMTTKWKKDE